MTTLAPLLVRQEDMRPQASTLPLKASIQDMLYLLDHYHLPDELFWEVFNARVLQNQPIDVDDFVLASYGVPGRA